MERSWHGFARVGLGQGPKWRRAGAYICLESDLLEVISALPKLACRACILTSDGETAMPHDPTDPQESPTAGPAAAPTVELADVVEARVVLASGVGPDATDVCWIP